MNTKDVEKILIKIDKSLASYKSEGERLTRAYQHRKAQLEKLLNLNSVIRDRAMVSLRTIEDTRKVQVKLTSFYDDLLKYTRDNINSYSYETIPPNAAPMVQGTTFLKHYTLIGYVHTVHVVFAITVSLRQIYQTGRRSELLPTLFEVFKVSLEVGVDLLAKYSGVEEAENVAMVMSVITNTRDAMEVSMDSLEHVSGWLDRLDTADEALQSWLASIASIIAIVQDDMERAVSVRDGKSPLASPPAI